MYLSDPRYIEDIKRILRLSRQIYYSYICRCGITRKFLMLPAIIVSSARSQISLQCLWDVLIASRASLSLAFRKLSTALSKSNLYLVSLLIGALSKLLNGSLKFNLVLACWKRNKLVGHHIKFRPYRVIRRIFFQDTFRLGTIDAEHSILLHEIIFSGCKKIWQYLHSNTQSILINLIKKFRWKEKLEFNT